MPRMNEAPSGGVTHEYTNPGYNINPMSPAVTRLIPPLFPGVFCEHVCPECGLRLGDGNRDIRKKNHADGRHWSCSYAAGRFADDPWKKEQEEARKARMEGQP